MDKFRYINHLGQSISFWSSSIIGNYKSAKQFKYTVNNGSLQTNGKNFEALMVCIGRETANKLIDILETDSIKNENGRFYINDWYIKCKYTGIPNIVAETENIIKISIPFYAENVEFTKETSYTLSPTSGITEEYFDFPFDYEFDFGSDKVSMASVVNNELADADFILKFSVPTSSVNFSIDSHAYIVDAPINAGETFVLNTDTKTVYKESAAGKTDLFGAAGDTSYIFEQIQQGTHKVTWTGEFPVTFIVLEHRKVPPWI